MKENPRLRKRLSIQEQTSLANLIKMKLKEESEDLENQIYLLNKEVKKAKNERDELEQFFQKKEHRYHSELDQRMQKLEEIGVKRKIREVARQGEDKPLYEEIDKLKAENDLLKTSVKESNDKIDKLQSELKKLLYDVQRSQTEKNHIEKYYLQREKSFKMELDKHSNNASTSEEQLRKLERQQSKGLMDVKANLEMLQHEVNRLRKEMYEKETEIEILRAEAKLFKDVMDIVDKLQQDSPPKLKEFLHKTTTLYHHSEIQKLRGELLKRELDIKQLFRLASELPKRDSGDHRERPKTSFQSRRDRYPNISSQNPREIRQKLSSTSITD